MAAGSGAFDLRDLVLRLTSWMTQNPVRERRVQVAAALLAFQGTAFVLIANKLVLAHPAVFFVGIVMALVGAFLLAAPTLQDMLLPKAARERKEARAEPLEPTLADRLLDRLTLGGRLTRFFPIFGALVFVFDFLYNRYLTASPTLASTDFAVLGLGAVLVAFPFFPATLSRERNFLLLFFAALSLIFGVPLLALRAGSGQGSDVNEYTASLVTPQLAWVLNALGMGVTYTGIVVTYPDLATGGFSDVSIATSCSGLYSMGIFMAAFAALVISEYGKLSWRVGALLGIGLLCAYLANLLRMVIIVEAGHHYGTQALLWTHANLGDMIFLLWVAPFVWVTFRVLDPASQHRTELEAARFQEALKTQGIDPASVGEKDWFCASCYTKVEAPAGKGPENCPSCGAALG